MLKKNKVNPHRILIAILFLAIPYFFMCIWLVCSFFIKCCIPNITVKYAIISSLVMTCIVTLYVMTGLQKDWNKTKFTKTI
jgi:hypothetical protein